MIDRHQIPFKHWSLRVGRADPRTGEIAPYYGEIATAIADLHQSISNIILTPIGSVPTEPTKGCDIEAFIDKHPDVAIPNLTRVIWDVIGIWEPRIIVETVTVQQVAFSHYSCDVFWRPVASVLADLLVTSVELANNGNAVPAGGAAA